MDDFDDYFQDSFELNEDDLAILDREEQKHAEEIIARTQKKSQSRAEQPPKKRKRSLSRDDEDLDDIVDVFIRPNGLYGTGSTSSQQATAKVIPTNQEIPPTRKPIPNSVRQPAIASSASRPLPISQTHLTSQATARLLSSNNERQGAQKGNVVNDSEFTSKPASSSRTDAENAAIKEELERNRENMERLERQVKEGQQTQKELQMAKFTSEGEASILRKKLEKLSQQMVESERRLKDLEEVRQREKVLLQKEHKESLDRLRTEQQFKQHEFESSVRKASLGTARLNRIAANSQQSPIPLPAAMRDWTSGNKGLTRNTSITLTPSRSPATRKLKQRSAIQASVAELRFPGFEDSFAPTSQRLSPSKGTKTGTPTRKKGKEKANSSEAVTSAMFSPSKGPPRPFIFDAMAVDDSIQDFDAEMAFADGSPRRKAAPSPAVEDANSSPVLPDSPNLAGVDLFPDSDDNNLAVVEPYQGINWKEELHDILFSHVCVGSKLNTLHQLISAVTEDVDYVQATSTLIEAVGSKLLVWPEANLERVAAESLVTMGLVLSRRQALPMLRTFFELLSALSLAIYDFPRTLLTACGSVQNLEIPFLAFVREAMAMSLSLTVDSEIGHPNAVEVIHDILQAIESLFWMCSESECSVITDTKELFPLFKSIFELKKFFPVVSHGLRALVALASHPSLLEPLIIPHDFPVESSEKLQAVLVEKLSNFLVDPVWTSDFERYASFSHIFQFFALLSEAREGAKSYLVKSPTNILCIIQFLANQTSLLWEEDERILDSEQNAALVVQNIVDALQLLHRLAVRGSQSGNVEGYDFKQKLYYAPHIDFNGLVHMFIVMIGRLSYADPPDWLSPKLQADVERLMEPARDLLDMVIEGPEGDSVWEAYQEHDNDNENEVQETQTEEDIEMDDLVRSLEL